MTLRCDKDGQLCFTDVMMPCRMGLRMRTAANMIRFAQRFKSRIILEKGKISTDMSSILGLLMLGASWNSRLRIKVEGEDAALAARCLEEYFDSQDLCLDV